MVVDADEEKLLRVLSNLVSNAIKFSPPGSVIRLYTGDERGQIMAFIEDEGSGIPDSEKAKVFKHFYRGDTSRSSPGNGLGLSLVHAVAEQHHAHVALEDAAPGLRVRVTFQPYQ